MVKRKPRSPKEILSFFNDIIRPKKDDGESATDSLSTLNAIQTQETNGVQERLDAHRPEQSDYAPEQPTVPRPETSPTPKSRWPSWTHTETASAKQANTDTAMKAIPEQTSRQQTREQIKNKLFRPKASGSTTGQKTMMILVPVLFIVLIFVLIQFSFVPRIMGRGTSNLVVKGILYNEANPSAIVNNQVVYEGDKISGATIIKINKDSIEFEVRKWWPIKAQRYTKRVRH